MWTSRRCANTSAPTRTAFLRQVAVGVPLARETVGTQHVALFAQMVKMGVQYSLWGGSVVNLGTEAHHKQYFDDIDTFQLPGTLLLKPHLEQGPAGFRLCHVSCSFCLASFVVQSDSASSACIRVLTPSERLLQGASP